MPVLWRPSAPRTIRQRRRRANAAQVSAVATLLGLMLVVAMIANFVADQLPQDMRTRELQHDLNVEDQFARLQATLLAQVHHPPMPQSLGTPVTLGSQPEPPFGEAATGSIASSGYATKQSLSVVAPAPPNWGHGNLCTTFTAGTCHNSQSNVCSPPLRYNESANNASITFALTGSNDCIVLNFTGNGDTITLGVTGSNLGYFVLLLFGFNDTVVLTNQFSGSGFHAFFYLFGGYNTYKTTGGPTGSGMFLNTYFIGQTATPGSCPADNLSATDHWSISGSSSSNSLQNLTWNNSAGYATPYHKTSGWPGAGNSGTGNHVGWQNVSAPTACAFVKLRPFGSAWGGLSVTLNNIYVAREVVALDSGAVVAAGTSGSVMISPPPWRSVVNGSAGTALDIVFLTLAAGSGVSESGRRTAVIETGIVEVTTVTISTGNVALSLVTAFPEAWMHYLTSPAANTVPGSTTCSGTATTCVTPAPGTLVTVSTELRVTSVTITYATVSLAVE